MIFFFFFKNKSSKISFLPPKKHLREEDTMEKMEPEKE
jgi:hypothetical protein